MNTLGARVRYARKAAGLSQKALAAAIGVKQPTISELENGESRDSTYLPEIERETGFRAMWIKTGRGPEKVEDPLPIKALLADRSRGALEAAEISIPQLDVQGAMGNGAIPPDHVDVVRNVVVNRYELAKQCAFTAPQNLQIITGYGRSMQPTFSDGDPLLIDTGVTSVTIDAVYVFEIDGALYIKGLQRIPGNGLRVISHNRDEYDAWDISKEQAQTLAVRGRVVMAWNARRL